MRFKAALLLLAMPPAWSDEPPGSVAPILHPPTEEVLRCFPTSARASRPKTGLRVVATVSLEGKAGNLRFPPEIEPSQETTARCLIELMRFDPATLNGVPFAAEVSIPLDLLFPDRPTVVKPRLKRDQMTELSDCYSYSARRAGAEGEIRVELTIGHDGSVAAFELPPGVEPWQKKTAECLIPRLRFTPATEDGKPVTANVTFPITFSLEGNDPLTLAKLNASSDDVEAAAQKCYPAGSKGTATPQYKVTVNVRGFPSQVMLVESSGDKEMDKAGACMVKKLRFEPARRGERAVMSTLLVPMTVRPPNGQ